MFKKFIKGGYESSSGVDGVNKLNLILKES